MFSYRLNFMISIRPILRHFLTLFLTDSKQYHNTNVTKIWKKHDTNATRIVCFVMWRQKWVAFTSLGRRCTPFCDEAQKTQKISHSESRGDEILMWTFGHRFDWPHDYSDVTLAICTIRDGTASDESNKKTFVTYLDACNVWTF